MRVVWSPLADRQVDDAVEYIAHDDPIAARKWLECLLERVKALSRFPDSGRMVPETQREDIREIIVSPYRVMYRRRDDRVEIVAIRHESRAFGRARGVAVGCIPAQPRAARRGRL